MHTAAPPLLVRIPAPFYVLVYLGAAELVARSLPGGLTRYSAPIVGVMLVFVSVFIVQWALGLFYLQKTTINPAATRNAALVETGIYAHTRNPMYLSLVIATVGIALMVGHWPLYVVPVATFATASMVFIPFEEAQMKRQFGERYHAYTAKVRRWL